MVELKYFAGLREQLGLAHESVELPEHVRDVAALTEWLRSRGGSWREALAAGKPVKVAVNRDMAQSTTALHDGDEVAYFPPVTGG